MNWLTPFQYDFMLTALALSALVGLVCAVLSCFLILKGWSLMGDAISHAVLPGVVIAYVVGLPLAIGAFLSGLLCAVGTGFIKNHSRVKEDTVMGVVFTGLFALGWSFSPGWRAISTSPTSSSATCWGFRAPRSSRWRSRAG